MNNIIHIPPPIYVPTPENYDCVDHIPSPLKVHLIGYSHPNNQSITSFYLKNTLPICISPNTSQTIAFPVTVLTNLPAVCVLTCTSNHLYKKRLTYNISISHTNDTFLEIPLFNYSKSAISLAPGELHVHCKIYLLGKPSNNIRIQ